jgi:HlyD family secretion protein
MKKKGIWIAIIFVVIVGSVLGFTLIRKGRNGVVKYRTEPVSRGDIEAVVVTSGTLNPIELTDVGSQVSGKIDKLYVDYNSQVTKGQVVAELDLDPLKMQVEQSEANYKSRAASLERAKVTLENLKSKYERAQSLFDKKLIAIEDKELAEANYLNAKSDVISAEASLSQAKAQLDLSNVNMSYATIRSPVDGVVITRKVNVGQTIQASYQAPVLFQVATDLTKMKVECSVDEADIGRVKEGQKARFTVEAYPNETFSGTVQQVRYAAETVSNVVTYTTVINVENPEKKLRPGMTATVSIVVGEAKNVLRVPNSALRFTPELSQAEMERIMKDMSERMQAQRQAQGGQPGAATTQGGPAQSARRTEGQRPQGQGSQAMGSQGFSVGAGVQRRQPSRVWVQDKLGKLSMVFIRPGVTDNTYTEILRSDLKEGDPVIVGTEGSGGSAANAAGRGGPGGAGRMMFIGR